MSEIKILILDDNIPAIETYESGIRRYNRAEEKPGSFFAYTANDLESAYVHIDRSKLDTAIVDLRLDREEGPMENGNEAIARLIESFRLPVFVVTGSPSDLAEEYENHPMIKVVKRADVNTPDLLDEIASLHNSHYIQFFTRNGFLEKKINELYWDHFNHTSDAWLEVASTEGGEFDKIISRHTVACLNEQLYVNGNIGRFDKYHAGEVYICPPIKQHYHTGDIVQKDDKRYVIMNPACDIVNKAKVGKLDFYLLVEIVNPLELSVVLNKRADAREGYIESSIANNQTERYHYMPAFADIQRGVIDFQKMQNIDIGESDKEEFIKTFDRIGSISSPFLKDVIARFSLYYARQGQPNLM